MKANQKFKGADDAVSPVIGVILMVAITVVLAAVVFVLVSNIGGDANAAPTISWSQKENTDRLEVVSATSGADWSRLYVRASSCTAGANHEVYIGGDAATRTTSVNVDTTTGANNDAVSATQCTGAFTAIQIGTTVSAIVAGDFVEFCASPDGTSTGASAATNVVIVITDNVANSKVGEWTFSSIAAC